MHLRCRGNLLQMQRMSFRTPLALMQVQLDLYNSTRHPGNDADTYTDDKNGYGTERQTQQNGKDASRHE